MLQVVSEFKWHKSSLRISETNKISINHIKIQRKCDLMQHALMKSQAVPNDHKGQETDTYLRNLPNTMDFICIT